MTYAGIGSRKTPHSVLMLMTQVGKFLSENNVLLRSGHAGGADLAFETGCDEANKNNKEIWIPWTRFNDSDSKFIVSSPAAFELASKYHPAWDRCSQGAKKLHARNMHQILGINLDKPCDFVICYTENGTGAGGTGQAIRLAKAYGIPIFDIGAYKTIEEQILETWKFVNIYQKMMHLQSKMDALRLVCCKAVTKIAESKAKYD